MASQATKGAARYAATGGLGLLIYFVGAPVWVLWAALGCLGMSGGIVAVKHRKKIKRHLRRRVPMPAKPRRQPPRRKPAVQKMTATSRGMQPARPTAPPPKPRVGKHLCSAACRMSKKPATTCDCSCGGRQHSVYARKGSDKRWSNGQGARR
jgi:hypothetical protein